MSTTFRAIRVGLTGLLAAACSVPSEEATPGAQDAAPAAESSSYAAGSCTVDRSWIESPSIPSEVPGDQSICNFEQLAWQALLFLVQPTAAGDVLQFESWMPHYGIFVGADRQPTAWGQHPPDPCNPAEDVAGKAIGSAPFVYSNLVKQAGSDHALIAPDGNLAYYGLRVNEAAYNMLTRCDLYRSDCAGPLKPGNTGPGVVDIIRKYPRLSFPDGAVELKTAWKVLTAEEESSGLFYSVSGWTDPEVKGSCTKVTFGLVGIHVVIKTPDFPALIWASFEHRNNAPDCSDLTATPPLGGSWNFFNASTCDNCSTNDYDPPNPTQVCRMHPQGDSGIGTFPNGEDCDANPNQSICQDPTRARLAESTRAIKEINASAQALIAQLSNKIDPVWANYELVGNVWTRDKVTPPQLQAQVGSLSAANTTMETYVQNGQAGQTNPNNCFSCHDQSTAEFGKNLPEVGLSHIFDKVQANTGGCSDGSLPAACEPYSSK